ncbi:WAT1-related protein [Parasponia andersonii]|uniref:WAT1-related protein n=1 Tax=Parasponia andersonii TaxID=3476 RepID=A0A2P5BF61_PARAD|nr:WAT1-related protein [Parasponia andersonii]
MGTLLSVSSALVAVLYKSPIILSSASSSSSPPTLYLSLEYPLSLGTSQTNWTQVMKIHPDEKIVLVRPHMGTASERAPLHLNLQAIVHSHCSCFSVIFLGDALSLGSVLGATILLLGFYAVLEQFLTSRPHVSEPADADGLPPCARLPKIALNTLSRSGVVSCFPSYFGRRPLGFLTPPTVETVGPVYDLFCYLIVHMVHDLGTGPTTASISLLDGFNNGFKLKPGIVSRRGIRAGFTKETTLSPWWSDTAKGRGPCGLVSLSLCPRRLYHLGQKTSGLAAISPSSFGPPIFRFDGDPPDAIKCEWGHDPDRTFHPVTSAEENRFKPYLPAGRLKGLEWIIIFRSPGDCRHIQAILNPLTMNMMPRMVTASSQLVGTNDLVAPSSHELEKAVRLVAEECVRLHREEVVAPKRARGSEIGPSANPSPVKGGATGHKARSKAPAGWHLMVLSGDEVPAVPHSDAGEPLSGGTSATRTVDGEETPLSLAGGSAAAVSSTPDSSSKSSAICLGREITELSGGAPRLNDDDRATLTLLRRRRSAHSGPPRGDAPPPSVADGAPSGAGLPSVTATTASGACPAGREGALTTSGAGPYSPGVSNAQKEGPAAEPELEALSSENVELVTKRTFAQLAAIQSFYSSRVRDMTEELSSRSALAERSEAALVELRSDFDLYQSLEEARVNSAVAHTLSVEKTRHEEMAVRLAEAEADKLAHSEAARLAQNKLKRQAELRLAALKDRLADVEKLKTRHQRQKSVERDHYSIKHYMQQLRDEISITYPADMLKKLAAEKEEPSTSASGAKELIPISGLPDRTSEAPGAQPTLGVSTGEGSSAVIVSIDKSDPGTPPPTGVGPSAGNGHAPMDRVSPPWAMTAKISSGDRGASFESSGPCSEPTLGIGRSLFGPIVAKEKAWAQLLPGTNRALPLQRFLTSPFVTYLPGSAGKLSGCAPLSSSYVFPGHRQASSMSDVTPIVRVFLRSAGKIELHSYFLFVCFLGPSTSDVTPIVRAFFRSAGKILLHSYFLFVSFLGSSMSDVTPIVRAFFRSAARFYCTAISSSYIFSGCRRVT